ncbi:hypothetical protein L345_16818 [Ophiophagus hannah]|uniref:Uncharacterized protein n=1 Tax=Ophiophagus hannah TaxID=8665 RepID=V8N741_OPHHA|nr:hypothetical protein L345_16818 [Ophiophagus hannah]
MLAVLGFREGGGRFHRARGGKSVCFPSPPETPQKEEDLGECSDNQNNSIAF